MKTHYKEFVTSHRAGTEAITNNLPSDFQKTPNEAQLLIMRKC